jgi:hypothetical protein
VGRETKFGYGFLLAGIGLPILIVVIWGERFAAAIVGSLLAVAGITLLVAGHLHQDTPKKRTKMGMIGLFVLVGALMGAAVGLLCGVSLIVLKRQDVQPISSGDTSKNNVQPAPKEMGHPETHATSLKAKGARKRQNAATPSKETLHALTPLSEAKRFALKQKLLSLTGNNVCIVRVGHNPEMNVVYEQLLDGFEGWTVSAAEIGMVGVVGANFPDGPYLTGPNVSAPIVTQVYSAFQAVGIDLPLVPNAFMGPDRNATVVIVLH